MGKYRTNHSLLVENFELKRKLKIRTAQLTLTRAERDAARTALHNFNFEEQLAAIERRYGLSVGVAKK